MPISSRLEKADYYRRRQFIAVLQVIPLAIFTTYILAPLGVIFAWSLLDHWTLITWALVMVSFNLALSAFLYGFFSIELFAELDDNSRVTLLGIVGAFAATGEWMFASLLATCWHTLESSPSWNFWNRFTYHSRLFPITGLSRHLL